MVANQTLRAPDAVRERTTDIALRVVQVLLAAFFLLAAARPQARGSAVRGGDVHPDRRRSVAAVPGRRP